MGIQIVRLTTPLPCVFQCGELVSAVSFSDNPQESGYQFLVICRSCALQIAQAQPDSLPMGRARKYTDSELMAARKVYRAGMSYRDFARAFRVGKDKAGELIAEMKDIGFIE